MAGRKNGLGRGLDAFFPDRTSVVKEPARKTITKTVKTEKKSDVAEKTDKPYCCKEANSGFENRGNDRKDLKCRAEYGSAT